jgi:hypothetical protein
MGPGTRTGPGPSDALVSASVDVYDVNAYGLLTCKGTDNGAQRACGSSRASNDATQVLGVYTNFEEFAVTTAPVLGTNSHVVWVIDDTSHKVLEGVG